jgi:hypothetical protein
MSVVQGHAILDTKRNELHSVSLNYGNDPEGIGAIFKYLQTLDQFNKRYQKGGDQAIIDYFNNVEVPRGMELIQVEVTF